MSEESGPIILIDLPTFPKGVISLSLLLVATQLSGSFEVQIIDLNIVNLPAFSNVKMFGLKVSAQNFKYAVQLSQKLRALYPSSKIIWGGELPTLLTDKCLLYADSVISGLFEPVAQMLVTDLKANNLKPTYTGSNTSEKEIAVQDFSLLSSPEKYYQFMGYPLETTRGCTEKCIFCMVHTMQKKNYNLLNFDALKETIKQYKGKFINVVDYNFGVNAQHAMEVAALIKDSGALGWMAEMCIELLDNDEILTALKLSRCKMIYCGLESIDQQSLNSVHKMNTNHIENYERIIRKVQSYGIQVAAGIILGLEGTHKNTFDDLFAFYHRMGIIYAKLTFLTYNPGTKVHEYVKKRGVFLTEEIDRFDGNQLTYLPQGVDAAYVLTGTQKFIQKYYSLRSIFARSFNTKTGSRNRIEFILFNICYRKVYMEWLEYNTLQRPENLNLLLSRPFKKSWPIAAVEKALHLIRLMQMN